MIYFFIGRASLCAALATFLSIQPALAFDGAAMPNASVLTPNEAMRDSADRTLDEKTKALTALRYSAEQGEPAAQWKLGRMYADGDGVPQDQLRAFKYFSEIANAHPDENPGTPQARFVADAFVALAEYYRIGIPNTSIKANTARARALYLYAATFFGDADAQYQVGRLYLDSRPSEPREAARWFLLAANKGQCRAEAALGDILFQGRRLPRQAARGLMWLTLSRDCAGADESWVKPFYDDAFSRASDEERATALVYLKDWLMGHRN